MISKDELLRSLKRGQHTHAYLLCSGTREGAQEVFQHFVHKLFIAPFDQYIIEANEGTISIKEIRLLRARLALKPHSSSHHLAFFPAGEAMTVEAQNALLKILEEPPAPTVFILSAPDEQSLLPTIVSRCQRVRIPGQALAAKDKERITNIINMPLPEQFRIAEKLAKEEGLLDVLDGWMMELRSKLPSRGEKTSEYLSVLLWTKEKIMTTNVNKRLILEDLFLALTYPQDSSKEKNAMLVRGSG